jgi:hypothetical protein
MVKVRPFQFTDRYEFEKLINLNFEEKKIDPPAVQKITDTIGFFTTFPQCGKIIILTYNKETIGYATVLNQWKLHLGKISFKIEDIFISKNYRKYKPEISLIEFLLKQEKIHSIEIKIDKYLSKKVFKFFNFVRDFGPYFVKRINGE